MFFKISLRLYCYYKPSPAFVFFGFFSLCLSVKSPGQIFSTNKLLANLAWGQAWLQTNHRDPGATRRLTLTLPLQYWELSARRDAPWEWAWRLRYHHLHNPCRWQQRSHYSTPAPQQYKWWGLLSCMEMNINDIIDSDGKHIVTAQLNCSKEACKAYLSGGQTGLHTLHLIINERKQRHKHRTAKMSVVRIV